MATKTWKIEKDLCRCCHAEGAFDNLAEPRIFLEKEEVYSDMLRECLDIDIPPVPGELCSSTYTICNGCIIRLREACNFKKQVQDCEQRFMTLYYKNAIQGLKPATIVKEELEVEGPASDTEADLIVLKKEDEDDDDDNFLGGGDDVAPVVLATNPGNEEHPTDASHDWDILSFENNANVVEDPRKSQDTALIPKELLPTISDTIDYRTTRRNDRFKNEQNTHSPGIFGTQLGTHTDPIQYICDVCQKIFQRKASLVSHIRAHSFAKTLSCELRECNLNQNHMLSSPKTMHTFACELCKYKCKAKRDLVIHMRTHTGEKPFACKLCKYKCAQNNSLVKHMRTHTGEKPFACKLCEYKCTVNSSLVNHMRTHTGEKPFACKLCEYKCTVNSSLVNHMRTHTDEKPFLSVSYASSNVKQKVI